VFRFQRGQRPRLFIASLNSTHDICPLLFSSAIRHSISIQASTSSRSCCFQGLVEIFYLQWTGHWFIVQLIHH
jgi:hypothetical protein